MNISSLQKRPDIRNHIIYITWSIPCEHVEPETCSHTHASGIAEEQVPAREETDDHGQVHPVVSLEDKVADLKMEVDRQQDGRTHWGLE